MTLEINMDLSPFRRNLRRMRIRPMRGRVGSDGRIAPYNIFVQDRQRQARWHRGRWLTLQESMSRREPRIRNMIEGHLRRAANRLRPLQPALRAGLDDGTLLLMRDMTTYPPSVPGSEYRRTGTLRRSWSHRVETL